MKKLFSLLLNLVFVTASLISQSALINEINHIANDPDGHGVEVVAAAGEDLTGWSLLIYTADGLLDRTIDLSGAVIPNQQNGYGTVWYDVVQNDGGNGAALVDPTGGVNQFVSYGAATSVTAVTGAASGQSADYIGTASLEGSLGLVGSSLGLGNFDWAATWVTSPGAINTDQVFMSLMGRDQITSNDNTKASFFPNPFVDQVQIRLQDPLAGTAVLTLIDVNGALKSTMLVEEGTVNIKFELNDYLPAGTYFLRLDSKEEQWVKVLIH